ncbi:hypothetical protein [Stenotrophomonas rhizophila]|uniref:hypothetical protein n=1 Tax=Stenotrophomonas rhizophila TaxID=216778 RepID=UPI0015E83874|nr:hypothetical protein [Stenotrophomonas rhizophila]
MRSDNNQLDIFKHDPRLQVPALKKLAKAHRESADEALKQFQFSAAIRQERHEHYMAEAKRIEAEVRQLARPPRRRRTRSTGATSP